MRFEYFDWILECDVEATRHAYSQIAQGGANLCVCIYCRNYRLVRRGAFPKSVQPFLKQLGIHWHREAEAYHMGRQPTGLHFYGGWMHFVGRIVQQGTEIKVEDRFSMAFTEQYAPMFPPFQQ
jgi:hypothetical protein